MASIEEVGVVVSIRVERSGPDRLPRLVAQARAVDAEGCTVRTHRQDITDVVSQARRDGAEALLADVEDRVRTLWAIP